MRLLDRGDRVHLVNFDTDCVVESFLGVGGQGEVWQVAVPEREPSALALKWLNPRWATAQQWEALKTLIEIGPPTDRFLWPMDLATGAGSFGYVMPVRGESFRSLADVVTRRVQPRSWPLVSAAMELVDSFYRLHSGGLCYRDISFGNAFFDFDHGAVLICDNDNVGVNGKAPATVAGTREFMAPEIVREQALPSTLTDLYSLSVMLFYMFMLHHPLFGRRELDWACMDAAAWKELTASPVFIFDPNDRSNAPLEDEHQNAIANWAIYPQFLRDLFVRAFTDGVRWPDPKRVRESEWRRAFARLRDLIFVCPRCGEENFLDPAAKRSRVRCHGCSGLVSPGATMRIGNELVVLRPETRLYPHHLVRRRSCDFSLPLAEVTQHPDHGRWGLRNLSDREWQATPLGGEPRPVAPSRTLLLQKGTAIDFGDVRGELDA